MKTPKNVICSPLEPFFNKSDISTGEFREMWTVKEDIDRSKFKGTLAIVYDDTKRACHELININVIYDFQN
jgi:hypothetical protein